MRAIGDSVWKLHGAGKTDHVIGCLEAAIINGQAQPWMYTVLALEMGKAGRPQSQIERVLLSNIDFSAVNVGNILYSAAYLARFGAKEKALEMYRQASRVDPARLEPYVHGLKLAREAASVDAVAWAATGILTRAWSKDYPALHRDAEAAARDLEASLRTQGREEEAQWLARELASSLVRDLTLELSWSGKADVDLLVEEPSGAICSVDNAATAGGGVFVHDGMGAAADDTFEKYVCPRGQSGEYRAMVRYVSGDVVGKRAVLKIIRYQGTPRQVEDRVTVALGPQDKIVRISLNMGRMEELSAAPLLQNMPAQAAAAGAGFRRETIAARRLPLRSTAAPGYQPIISFINEGVTLNAMAVVSGDRRYVRMNLQPIFNAITDVQTFSFINSGNPNGGSTGPVNGSTGFVTGFN